MTATITRRDALRTLALGSATACFPTLHVSAQTQRKKRRVAAVVTEYRTNSHADVIVGKILEGWRQDGGPGPDLELVSLYTDQVRDGDLSRGLARKHGFHIAKTIDEAVTLGGDELAVDGVLSIGEHGQYPYTEDTKQHMYPRRRFFDEIVAAMRRCGQFAPIFNDKHLSYRWDDAHHMYQTAQRLHIPVMAGSSVPVAWRFPPLELPRASKITEAMAVGYGGLEAYGFHALEALQCMVERRNGGETGVTAVTAFQGDAIWAAEKKGLWSRDLLESALGTFGLTADKLEERLRPDNSALFRIEYRDGLNATLAMLSGVATQFAFACRVAGQPKPLSSWFRLEEEQPYGHFAWLLRAIEHMLHTGQPAYPVERTLLTTGILDRAMHSLHQKGARLESPELGVRYEPASWSFANAREDNFPS